jgi:hypothetical protein
MPTILEKAEKIFEKNFRLNMKSGSIEAFKKSYRTLYNKVILPTIEEIHEIQHEVYEIPIEFIENSLKVGILISQTPSLTISEVSPGNDLKRIYFAGQGLCLDTRDEFGFESVITINWSDKKYGLFTGGPRLPLSEKALDMLKELMSLNEINYTE